MTTIERTHAVIGGVDTHGQVHVAAAIDTVGGVLGTASFPTTRRGYDQLLGWLRAYGPVRLVGVEGTGAYGAGLTRRLSECGVAVSDVSRPNRQERRRQGKSDVKDAVEAARAALSGRCQPVKTKIGPTESIRVLLVARRSATQARTKALVQMRHLVITAPDEVRRRFGDVSGRELVDCAARLRPGDVSDAAAATRSALRTLARRIRALDVERAQLERDLDRLTQLAAPRLRALLGVGVVTAATLLVTAGASSERLRSEAAFAHLCGVAPLEASSGKVSRQRLNRGGDRQANSALWRIVLVRMNCDQRTRDYVARRTVEGRSQREVMRCLKRYVAREIYRTLAQP